MVWKTIGEENWSVVVSEVQSRLQRKFRAKGIPPADCDDLVQEVLLRCHKYVSRKETVSIGLVNIIAKGVVANYLGGIARRKKAALPPIDPPPSGERLLLLRRLLRNTLREADELRGLRRQIILNHYFLGLSYAEITRRLNVTKDQCGYRTRQWQNRLYLRKKDMIADLFSGDSDVLH